VKAQDLTLIELKDVISDFAQAFKAVDTSSPRGRSKTREYLPGIGPLTENEAVKMALKWLKETRPSIYSAAGPKPYPGKRQTCDLVIPGEWAIEFKLARPFGDNGAIAEHWSENLLHPYLGNTSAIGDTLKLVASDFPERRAVVIFAFQRAIPKLQIETAVRSFEGIVTQVLRVKIGTRESSEFTSLIHPHHQHGLIFGWEIFNLDS
jgi:hypothetical protein